MQHHIWWNALELKVPVDENTTGIRIRVLVPVHKIEPNCIKYIQKLLRMLDTYVESFVKQPF